MFGRPDKIGIHAASAHWRAMAPEKSAPRDWRRGGGRAAGVDREGKFVWKEGEAVLAFGKHQGKPLRRVAREDPGYLEWVARSDFPEDAKRVASDALEGHFPAR